MADAKWYIVHTYSGYENKVKDNIDMTVKNRGLGERIIRTEVPMEKAIEVKDGVKKTVDRKVFPGYVLIFMVLDEETWYVVRNTRGVTGFVGPGSEPVPLTDEEVRNIGLDKEKETAVEIDFKVGDTVTIIEGNLEGKSGIVQQIDLHKQTVIISVEMFGRETPTEVGFTAVKAGQF